MALYSEILAPQGRDTTVRITIVHGDAPVDLTEAATKLWFVAKRSKLDADADFILQKTYDSDLYPGVYGGIDVAPGETNIAIVKIDAAATTGLTFTRGSWECVLQTPDTLLTTVAYGTIELPRSVAAAPA